ncbi:MAG: 4Fe-4S dicluster domain-containing protein [Actinomycetota bacterium]
MSARIVDSSGFDLLIPLLSDLGYTVIGPTVHEGVIVYDEIEGPGDLPIGWTEATEAGTYGLVERDDEAYFGFTVGPRTLKTYLFPPKHTLLTIRHVDTGLAFDPEPVDPPRYAFVGARACEIAAMGIQDRVFTAGVASDPYYTEARNRSFIVGVNCSVAAATCFCDSMGTGPRCTTGYDIVMTELMDGEHHEFALEAGTDAGEDVINALESHEATSTHREQVDAVIESTRAHMGRSFPRDEAYELLTSNLEHPIWDSIAERCLSCTSCTLVCPTCFCSTVEDATDLEGTAARTRSWDSCFSLDFTNLHGHSVRSSPSSRYRQWMTHKLAYWYDQFGTSGCVGCGRCITWCPVGIDITAEIAVLKEQSKVTTP